MKRGHIELSKAAVTAVAIVTPYIKPEAKNLLTKIQLEIG